MIKRLVLENFRRHEHLDINFEDSAQIVLISGRNGAGKSTILEGITFALYGEGRHGKRNLNDLVRRGAELEGITAEVEFTVGQDVYRVHRRRDGKASTAVLYGNDVPLCEGVRQVSAEIEKLLGMDSAGFRLAVIAQQKDIDGLASLRPAERVQMLTRLLRLDVISAAKEHAGAAFRGARERALALREAGDDGTLAEACRQAQGDLALAQDQRAQAETSAAKIDSELETFAGFEDSWRAAQQEKARLEGDAEARARELARLSAQLSGITSTQPPVQPQGWEELSSRSREVERSIAEAESQARAAEQRKLVMSELARIEAAIEKAETVLDSFNEEELRALTEQEEDVAAKLNDADQLQRDAEGQARDAAWQVKSFMERLEKLQSAGATCEECGQEITEEHRSLETANVKDLLAEAEAEHVAAQDRLKERAQAASSLHRSMEAVREAVTAVRAKQDAALSAAGELGDLKERWQVFQGQVDRLPEESPDLDALYAERADISLLTAQLSEQVREWESYQAAVSQAQSLAEAVEAAEKSQQEAARLLGEFDKDKALESRHAEYMTLLDAREAEAEMVRHWREQVAILTERVAHFEQAIERAERTRERQQAFQTEALENAAAARLLSHVSDHLATIIRPSLEGAVSALITTMSDGRFTRVEIDDEYSIRVHDDGSARDLANLSGGEVDLVALAMRLALSQVVTEQHGSGGAGFLILDECFGSQDPARREAIMSALRSLRSVYPQILLISHVEGMDDAADMVIEVMTSEDREETTVRVA